MINTKVFGEKKKREALRIIRDAISSAKFENASFDKLYTDSKYPTKENDVTKFIKERTELYMASWVISRLKALEDLINGTDRSYE